MIIRVCGVTSRMTAEMAVMERTKAVTRPERKESLMRGSVTVMNTWKLFAPMSYADSSMDLSIWRRAEMPERVPVGSERTMKTITRMAAVP